jgi:signal transduction histidine kinase
MMVPEPELSSVLLEENKMAALGRLLAGVIHEINTPMGSISSNNQVMLRSLELVKKALADPQPATLNRARDVLDTCISLAAVDRTACDRILGLIRGVKTYSRTGDSALSRVDLNEQLRLALKLMHVEFRRRIIVETDYGELPPVECYAAMLDQVFLNLLVNAGQAIEGEGRVRVRTCRKGAEACISISDTGRGIMPEDKQKIFTQGFTTKPIGVGSGLGLAISHEIVVEKHGGRIEFESEPGAGTTFHIHIPLEQTKA